MNALLPGWARLLLSRHLLSRSARPAVRWMNRFAFLGVIVSVFAWIAVVSVMDGLQGEIRTRILREKPHLLWDGPPTAGIEAKRAELESRLHGDLASVRFLLQTEGLLEMPSSHQTGRIRGAGVVIQGVPNLGHGLQAGAELASLLMLGVGDEIRLRSAWKLEGIPLTESVTGVFETGVPDIDRSTVRLDREALENWLGMPASVSKIEIQLQDPERADAVRAAASDALGVPLKTWHETHASLWYSLRLEKLFMTIVVFFVVILAGLAVHLSLAVRVTEKTREIGLLRALGADRRSVVRLFVAEGLVIGAVGALLGLAGAWIFCHWLAGNVRLPEFYYSTAIPVSWQWGRNLAMASLAALTAGVASLGPALRAGRCSAAESLRS
jgi:lipoprotein-releasing system permease protein